MLYIKKFHSLAVEGIDFKIENKIKDLLLVRVS